MKTILITTSSFGQQEPELINKLERVGLQVVLNPFKRKLTEVEVTTLIEEHQPVGIIAGVEPLTRQVFKKAPNLKVISRCGIGMDAVDLDAATELKVIVTNTPDAPTIPVAELTLCLLLTLLRKVHLSDASIREGGWQRPMGSLLHDKTVGLIDCGRIGSYVTKLLTAFGCVVKGCDPACKNDEKICLTESDYRPARADIVSLHVPYSEETHHFMNRRRIQAMKSGAYLVNTARGGLVDEDALLEALQSGHLSGAAIDSFEQEPYTGPLKDLPAVLLTAHIGSYAREGRIMMERHAVDNLLQNLNREDYS